MKISSVLKLKQVNKTQAGYGYASAILIALVLILIFSEIKFDLFERMLGRMMQWSNPRRSQIGTTWEYQSQSALVMRKLSDMVSLNEEVRRELQSPDDFILLPQQLTGGKVLAISREKFLDLYQQIPAIYAQRLASRQKLFELTMNSGWQRTAFAGSDSAVDLYYLNQQNYVLDKVSLDPSFFRALERYGKSSTADIDTVPDFSGRVFDRNNFISAISQIAGTEEINLDLNYLKKSDLIKVGLSRRWEAGMVEMAFQYQDGTVVLYPVADELAFQLLDLLTKTESDEIIGEDE